MATAMNASFTLSCPHNGTAHDGTLLCHWTNSPGARGTLNIFWLCISTLGLCVWNAVHPDVPRPKTPWWRVFGKRLWWLFVGLFMPEMLVLVALGQFRQAWQLLANIDADNCAPTQFPWWMYLLEAWRPKHNNIEYEEKWYMRPLLHYFPTGLGWANVISAEECGREHCWTLTHSFYAVMNGFVDEKGHTIAIDRDDKDEHDGSITVLQRIALPLGNSKRIPDVSVDDIDDRGKAGILAKALLVWQLFVFLATCFARWHQSLPLSLLEITTIGHSLCSIIAMVLWWYKPHSIGEATVIDRTDSEEIIPPSAQSFALVDLLNAIGRGIDKVTANVDTYKDLSLVTVLAIAIAVLYGLPHLLGLSIHFSTFAEQLCWKLATFTVIGSPLVMCAIIGILPLTGMLDRTQRAVQVSLISLFYILLFLYPMASMFLVAESVRQISALPVESFREPQLTSYLPSIS